MRTGKYGQELVQAVFQKLPVGPDEAVFLFLCFFPVADYVVMEYQGKLLKCYLMANGFNGYGIWYGS